MNLIICNHSLGHLSNMADNNNVLGNHDSTQEEMMNEMCLLVNKMDEVIGTKSKLDCHYGLGDRHRAFSVVLFDESGKMIVQQRSSDKITFPSVWANTCCSHPLDMISENTQDLQGIINAAIRNTPSDNTRTSLSWSSNDISAAAEGTLRLTDTALAAALPTNLTNLYLRGTGYGRHHLLNIIYYQKRLANSVIEANSARENSND